ncbi:hypothetical protein HDK64DRAFT_272195 [Phyllosticta capitalensis]
MGARMLLIGTIQAPRTALGSPFLLWPTVLLFQLCQSVCSRELDGDSNISRSGLDQYGTERSSSSGPAHLQAVPKALDAL